MFFILVGGLVVVTAGLVGAAVFLGGRAKKALVGVTAAGALVVIPYAVHDESVSVVIDPTTGRTVTAVNGVGFDPSTGRTITTTGGVAMGSNGAPLVAIPLSEREHLEPQGRSSAVELLAEEGVAARPVSVPAPAGFEDEEVPALIVDLELGETPEEARARVEAALERQGVETTRLAAPLDPVEEEAEEDAPAPADGIATRLGSVGS